MVGEGDQKYYNIYTTESTESVDMAGPNDVITVNSFHLINKRDLHDDSKMVINDYFESKIDRAKKIINNYGNK